MTDLGRLLRVAGRRPVPSAQARARARAAAHEAWMEALETNGRERQRMWWKAGMALAAAIIAVVWLSWPGQRPDRAGTAAVDALRIVGPAAVPLIGGGSVRVREGASARLAQREITLDEGHIYVDAGPEDAPGVIVNTPAGQLRDIGTRFDVVVTGLQVQVRVREGAVRLTHDHASVDARKGQGIRATPGQVPDVFDAVTFGADWDWVVEIQPFRIDGASLRDFLAWVEREGGLSVEFADPRLRAQVEGAVLNGTIAGLGVHEAIGVVLGASDLAYDITGGRLVVRGRGRQ